MSYHLGRDEMFWRIGHEDSEQLIDDIRKLKSVNFVDEIGLSYLHMACTAHNLKVAELLLKKGADPNYKDKEGGVPIMSAIGSIHETNPDFLRVFLQYGLDLNIKQHDMTLKEMIESFEDEELNTVMKEFERLENGNDFTGKICSE
ncbi:MAG: ankyrin repeat domain-containing protein [Lachnospiraceae bacterium]|nr:ankyrin repeat domain-containing protein [Lachnospiraceae bacterium]